MVEYISKKSLISLIEHEYAEWGDDYDIEQVLKDIEDYPAEYTALVTLPVTGDHND